MPVVSSATGADAQNHSHISADRRSGHGQM